MVHPDEMSFLLATVHLLLAAVWLGAMAYSIGVVQPKLLKYYGSPQKAEEAATFVAAGARWKVVGFIAVIALSGALLVVIGHSGQSGWWWAIVGAKVVLLVAASALFWYVSWRMWPRRVFALPAEVPGWQAAFRRVGWALIVLVGAASVLGVALRTLA